MIIVDSNNVVIAACAEAQKAFGGNTTFNDARNYLMQHVLGLRKKFGSEYGNEMVFAFDGKSEQLWRRKAFPYYKVRRANKKASSPLDWEFIGDFMEAIKEEFIHCMPYKVVCLSDCEGDDIIGSIIQHRHKSLRDEIGSKYDNRSMIVSADHDMLQLQRLQGIDQWNSTRNEHVRSDSIEIDYLTKVIKGDAGDDVPSCISQDDIFMIGQRQKPISQKMLDKWIPMLMEGVIPEELVYYERNKSLISLFDIPYEVQQNVITAYENAPVASKSTMLEYFNSHKLGNFIENLHLF
jgi:hypothetical protein